MRLTLAPTALGTYLSISDRTWVRGNRWGGLTQCRVVINKVQHSSNTTNRRFVRRRTSRSILCIQSPSSSSSSDKIWTSSDARMNNKHSNNSRRVGTITIPTRHNSNRTTSIIETITTESRHRFFHTRTRIVASH
jgi:hypothetical protein